MKKKNISSHQYQLEARFRKENWNCKPKLTAENQCSTVAECSPRQFQPSTFVASGALASNAIAEKRRHNFVSCCAMTNAIVEVCTTHIEYSYRTRTGHRFSHVQISWQHQNHVKRDSWEHRHSCVSSRVMNNAIAEVYIPHIEYSYRKRTEHRFFTFVNLLWQHHITSSCGRIERDSWENQHSFVSCALTNAIVQVYITHIGYSDRKRTGHRFFTFANLHWQHHIKPSVERDGWETPTQLRSCCAMTSAIAGGCITHIECSYIQERSINKKKNGSHLRIFTDNTEII